LVVTLFFFPAKLECHTVPRNSEFNLLVGNKYKLIEFVQVECTILTFFKWELMYPTAAHFAEYYSLYAILPNDMYDGGPVKHVDQMKVYIQKYIDYFLGLSLKGNSFFYYNQCFVTYQLVLHFLFSFRYCFH